jgi:hypothetical protein
MHPFADKTYQKAMDYVDEVFRAKSAVRWYYGAGKVIQQCEPQYHQ